MNRSPVPSRLLLYLPRADERFVPFSLAVHLFFSTPLSDDMLLCAPHWVPQDVEASFNRWKESGRVPTGDCMQEVLEQVGTETGGIRLTGRHGQAGVFVTCFLASVHPCRQACAQSMSVCDGMHGIAHVMGLHCVGLRCIALHCTCRRVYLHCASI